MNTWQKIAWFNLIVLITSLTIAGAAVGILTVVYGMPKALAGLGFLGIAGLVGLSPILFRRKAGQLGFDERDLIIHRRAALAAYSAFWVFFSVACMAPWFVLGRAATIRVVVLPCMLGGGFIIVQLIQSIVILVQDGTEGKGEKS
jgi:hypothetical protein